MTLERCSLAKSSAYEIKIIGVWYEFQHENNLVIKEYRYEKISV